MPLRRFYPREDQLARGLSMVGDRWTLLIVREVLCGRGRFSEMRDSLGIAPTMLTKRLNRLAEEGFITREAVADDGRGTSYRPTAAAKPLGAVIASVEAFVDLAVSPCEKSDEAAADRRPL